MPTLADPRMVFLALRVYRRAFQIFIDGALSAVCSAHAQLYISDLHRWCIRCMSVYSQGLCVQPLLSDLYRSCVSELCACSVACSLWFEMCSDGMFGHCACTVKSCF